MKKSVSAALAAMMLMTASTAMAASFPEFKFDGDIKAHYRWNTDDSKGAAGDTEGGKFWLRLNATSEVAKNVSFYTRLTTQRLGGDNVGADFDNKNHYNDDHATAIDRIGFVVKGKDFNTTIGRQALFLGQGLLMDSAGYMGTNMGAIDGITASGKMGVTNLTFVAGQAWQDGDQEPKIYAIDASYSPAKDWTLGATVAKVNQSVDKDTTHYAVNAAYTAGKATYFGEYGKSNADADDKGYALGISYGLDKKNSLFAIYSNVEGNTDLAPGLTTYDNNGKGMYYGYSHKFNKDYTFDLFYKDMKTIETTVDAPAGNKYSSLRTTVTFKF